MLSPITVSWQSLHMPYLHIASLTLYILSVTIGKWTNNPFQFPLSVSCCQLRGPGNTLFFTPLGFNLSRVDRVSFLPHKVAFRRKGCGGVGEGVGLERHICVFIFTLEREERSHCMHIPSCSLFLSEWKSWGGVANDFATKCRGGNELDGTLLLYHVHLPFPSSVYFFGRCFVYLCVWLKISRGRVSSLWS